MNFTHHLNPMDSKLLVVGAVMILVVAVIATASSEPMPFAETVFDHQTTLPFESNGAMFF